MPELKNQQIVARQVERIVRQLSSLSTLPTVAAVLLRQLRENHFDPDQLAECIGSDPALTAKVLVLAHREGIQFTQGPTIEEAVAKLPLARLREAVISVKVFQGFDGAETAGGQLSERKQMALHSLATACCAGLIAERVLAVEQRQTAYLAGLLHDIGKYALDEVMPKSFQKMVEQARNSQSSLIEIEQIHLGLDHTVLGKRLGQKWFLPEPVVSAIWLHHCDAHALSDELPHVQIARIAALADRMVRQIGLGHSGSFDVPEGIEELAERLLLSPGQLDEISKNLPDAIRQKGRGLGLDVPQDASGYYTLIHQAAAELAQDNDRLRDCTQQHRQLSEQTELVRDFLCRVDERACVADIARLLASCWQLHCQSGLTCVYVAVDPTEPYVELAAIDRQGRIDTKTFQMPESIPPIPEVFRSSASIVPVADGAKWLTAQLGADFNPQLMKMAPLKMVDEVVGVLVFEGFTETADGEPLVCKAAAAAIAMAQAVRRNEQMAERFVQVMHSLRRMRSELAHQQSLKGLAEMAAGAAHELNNPLAVISGRAQLLMDTEADDDKQQILGQIKSRCEEISQIVTDLLSFAQPPQPQKRSVPVSELLNQAVAKTRQACGPASIEIDITGQEKDSDVYVDAHQVAQSFSFILNNALQSYKGGSGPIQADCVPSLVSSGVTVAIRDRGCGMDAETLAAACEPFFSAFPAGRRRGMGLAHARRLLRLNGGDLKLTSEPDKGSTVTITLPKV